MIFDNVNIWLISQTKAPEEWGCLYMYYTYSNPFLNTFTKLSWILENFILNAHELNVRRISSTIKDTQKLNIQKLSKLT